VRGSGTQKKTYTHELDSRGARLMQAEDSSFGLRFEGEFEIPTGMPPSFKAPDNELTWAVEVDIDIRGWPDWHHSYPLLAAPHRPRAR
jgi:hypothetical protein